MSVLEFAIYDRDDPNGTALTTLTDAECIAMDFRVGLNQEGAGSFTISRHHALANRTDIPDNAYIKVTIPSVDASPIFGFWADEFKATLISHDEEGGEHVTIGGPGTIDILRRAILMDVPYVVTQPARGSLDMPGKWHWINEPWGAVLTRGIEEGVDEPGEPLRHVTIDFDRVNDSDSVAWPTVSTIFEVTIGMDIHTLMKELVRAGGLYVVPEPDLLIHAYQTYGRSLLSSVFFAKEGAGIHAGNIITELVRTGRGTKGATVALVRGKDEVYATVESSVVTPGQVAFIPYDDTNELAHLEKVGEEFLTQREDQQNSVEFEITPGFDPGNGLYMPGPEGTSGHFWIGDRVRVDTGSDESKWEDDNAGRYVTGIRVALAEAVDDTDDTTSARSLRVVVECDGTTEAVSPQIPQPRIVPLGPLWAAAICSPDVTLTTGTWMLWLTSATGLAVTGTGSGTDYTINGSGLLHVIQIHSESESVSITSGFIMALQVPDKAADYYVCV